MPYHTKSDIIVPDCFPLSLAYYLAGSFCPFFVHGNISNACLCFCTPECLTCSIGCKLIKCEVCLEMECCKCCEPCIKCWTCEASCCKPCKALLSCLKCEPCTKCCFSLMSCQCLRPCFEKCCKPCEPCCKPCDAWCKCEPCIACFQCDCMKCCEASFKPCESCCGGGGGGGGAGGGSCKPCEAWCKCEPCNSCSKCDCAKCCDDSCKPCELCSGPGGACAPCCSPCAPLCNGRICDAWCKCQPCMGCCKLDCPKCCEATCSPCEPCGDSSCACSPCYLTLMSIPCCFVLCSIDCNHLSPLCNSCRTSCKAPCDCLQKCEDFLQSDCGIGPQISCKAIGIELLCGSATLENVMGVWHVAIDYYPMCLPPLPCCQNEIKKELDFSIGGPVATHQCSLVKCFVTPCVCACKFYSFCSQTPFGFCIDPIFAGKEPFWFCNRPFKCQFQAIGKAIAEEKGHRTKIVPE